MNRPRIAAIVTEYRPNSHADVIVGKFLRGLPCDDALHMPRVEIASLYLDQVNASDTGLETARAFGVPVFPSIRGALTLGGDALAVDGVLIIGEHGDYAVNERGQKLYPRRHLFEQVAGTLGAEGRPVPVFVDKHLSYNWADALWMFDRARALGIPLMAGSSLPVCWRRPWLEVPQGSRLDAALAIGYGDLEAYGFHALEVLQCMAERRAGGETGVARVQCLEGPAVWGWLASDDAIQTLAEAAASRVSEPRGPWPEAPRLASRAAAFVLEYRDGLRGGVLMLEGYCRSFAYAGMAEDAVSASEFVLQGGPPHAHFSYLCRNIEQLFLDGRPPYPVERTLLTTGMLAAAMDSRHAGHVPLATPHLAVAYRPADAPWRPSGERPSGATLAPWPPQEGGR
jgi:hypothetical protein